MVNRRFPPPWSVEELDALCERGPQKQYEISLLFLWHGGADAGCRIQTAGWELMRLRAVSIIGNSPPR